MKKKRYYIRCSECGEAVKDYNGKPFCFNTCEEAVQFAECRKFVKVSDTEYNCRYCARYKKNAKLEWLKKIKFKSLIEVDDF